MTVAFNKMKAQAESAAAPDMPFLFVVQVWGAAYTELFVEAMLPSALTPGNLGAFDARSEMRIYTTAADAATIKRSDAYRRACGMVDVRIVLIDASYGANNHEIMSECQRRAAVDAGARDLAIVFLAPDTVISDRMFSRIREIRCAGYRAVMLASVRVTRQTFMPALRAAFPLDDGVMTIGSRALVRLMLHHLHPISECNLWDSPTFTVHPSHVYWRVGDDGLLGMCAHIHPIMVHATQRDGVFHSTIDDDYVPSVVRDLDDIYVVTDSDDMMIVEISDRSQLLHPILPNTASALKVAQWSEWAANPFHRRYLQHDYRLHGSDVDATWNEAQAECDRVRGEVNALLARPLATLAMHDPLAFSNRMMFHARHSGNVETEKHLLVRRPWFGNAPMRALGAGYGFAQHAYGLMKAFGSRVYRAVAYDRFGPNIIHHAWLDYRALRRRLESALDRPRARILFAGGRQIDIAALDAVARHGHSLTRADIRELPWGNVVVSGDAPWNFADGAFDVVICFDFLEYFSRPEFAIAEMKRVLADDGTLMLCCAFLAPHDAALPDYSRFSAERLIDMAGRDIGAQSVTLIGGVGSALASIMLYWPRRIVTRSRIVKLLNFILFAAYVPYAVIVNILMLAVNAVDRSGIYYAYSLISGSKKSGRS